MKAKLILHILCPGCGAKLANLSDGIECATQWCGEKGKQYQIPTIDLVPLNPTTAPKPVKPPAAV